MLTILAETFVVITSFGGFFVYPMWIKQSTVRIFDVFKKVS